MGTEAAPVLFGIPFLICLVILVVLIFSESRHSTREDRLLGLGRGRLAKGYLGALGALLLLCIVASTLEGSPEIAALYFIVFGVFLVLLLTILFLPAMAFLRKFGYMSLLGVVFLGIVLSAALGVVLEVKVVSSMMIGGVLALAFATAARLPLLRSTRTSANSSLEHSREP